MNTAHPLLGVTLRKPRNLSEPLKNGINFTYLQDILTKHSGLFKAFSVPATMEQLLTALFFTDTADPVGTIKMYGHLFRIELCSPPTPKNSHVKVLTPAPQEIEYDLIWK